VILSLEMTILLHWLFMVKQVWDLIMYTVKHKVLICVEINRMICLHCLHLQLK